MRSPRINILLYIYLFPYHRAKKIISNSVVSCRLTFCLLRPWTYKFLCVCMYSLRRGRTSKENWLSMISSLRAENKQTNKQKRTSVAIPGGRQTTTNTGTILFFD